MQFLKIIFRKTKNAKMNLRTNSEPIMMWSGADATKAGHTCTSMYTVASAPTVTGSAFM